MLTRRSLLANAVAGWVSTGGSPVSAQEDPRIAWLQSNSSPLRSIDPADADFSDLEPLGKAIGDARIVMLGEQTHGDGAAFQGKCRLVQFLHQRMGFDVLAFESGFYDVWKAWDAVRAGEDVRRAAAYSIFAWWSLSREAKPIIDYVGANARSDRPLELAGFDCQFNSYAHPFLLADLAAFLGSRGANPESMPEWPRFQDVFQRIIADSGRYGYTWKPPEDDTRFVLAMLDTLSGRMASAQGDHAPFWRQLLRSMKGQAQSHFWMPRSNAELRITDYNRRDAAMGSNLVWLAREAHPRRKIIVWAATLHNLRNTDRLGPEFRDLVTMGHVAWQALGSQIYSLGFTCHEGESGWADGGPPAALERPQAGSLEALWGATSHQVAFVNLRNPAPGGEWLHAPVASWAIRREETVTTDWSQVLDGMVFIRTMRPSTSIN